MDVGVGEVRGRGLILIEIGVFVGRWGVMGGGSSAGGALVRFIVSVVKRGELLEEL